MAYINKKTRFATEGFRLKRLNPDGTIPVATRFLGFANTANLDAVLTAHEADMTIKIDNAAAETKTVDFTAASDESAVTVAEAVTALTAAAFTGITWSADTDTGRLKGVASSGTEIAVTGPLAAALDFGQGIAQGGNGIEFIKIFDDRAISLGMTKNKKDKEEIDLEGAKGGLTRMIVSAKLLGQTLALAMKDKDYELLELIQGGTFNRTTGQYDPPLSTRQDSPVFLLDVFSPIYGEGSNKMEDADGYEQLRFKTCIGMEGDVPIEAKAWANYAFDIEATEYTNASGVKESAWFEKTMTVEAFEALNVETV